MALPNTSEKSNSLDREENITKGNLAAKRVAVYTYNSDTDTLNPLSTDLVAGTDFDYVSCTSTDTLEDTIVYKLGGSGGTTVQTIVITYPSGADKASDSFSSAEYS